MTAALGVLLIGVPFVAAFALTLAVCLAIEGKPSVHQLLALGTPWGIGGVSLGLTSILKLYGYHDYLSLQTLGIFFLTVALMHLACMSWVGPRARARVRERRGGILLGGLLSIVCLALLPLLLGVQAPRLFDLVAGPGTRQGVVQELDLWRTRRAVHGGVFVVEGVRYRVPDMGWFGELATGQPVEFLHAPATGLAFAADQDGSSLLALLLIAGLLGLALIPIALAALEPATNGQSLGTSSRPTGAVSVSRSTRSLLRTIQERGDDEDAERAKQERES